jgi:hypothetical protein
MRILEYGVFAGKWELKRRIRMKFKGPIKEFRPYTSASQIYSQRWWGPKCYDDTFPRTKMKRTVFIRQDTLSWSRGWWWQKDTYEGAESQNCKTNRPEEDGSERAQKGPGPTGPVRSPWAIFVALRRPPPFDQDPLWCINSPCFRWLPHPFTRE